MASKAPHGRSFSWRLVGWGTAAALLFVPLIAGAPWSVSDYLFAAAVFAIVGGTFELAVRKSGNAWYRGAVAVGLATAFLLVWITGAVGIIGNEGNPANLMFFAVILVAIVGSMVARFEASRMAWAMAIAAAAQVIVGVVTAIFSLGASEPPFFPGVLILIGGFVALWLLSAWLFMRAARP